MMIDFEMEYPIVWTITVEGIGKWDWVHLGWKVLLELISLEKGTNLLVYQE
jgi:hypothetical protein